MQEPRTQLLSLGLSDSEITTYLAMIAGARSAADLTRVTRLKRPTVYYALGCLEKRGLISKTGMEGKHKFSVEPLQRLAVMAAEKEMEASLQKKNILELIPSLQSTSSPATKKPAVAFFEGVEAVKNVILDSLYCKNKKLNSIVPHENFFWQVGKQFVELFVEERLRHNIKTKNIWEIPVQKSVIQKYYANSSEVRVMPKIMKDRFQTTIFLYDDKTLYISSLKNCYCILITSQEHHDTMQAWFDGLWEASALHE